MVYVLFDTSVGVLACFTSKAKAIEAMNLYAKDSEVEYLQVCECQLDHLIENGCKPIANYYDGSRF